ncbi:MAG: AAA family ATPase, partial [Candidatus Kerfeldbacteria bacterium]|nr:AAA family ATPase [Candidatus Kerfeldbacteria bacterium]
MEDDITLNPSSVLLSCERCSGTGVRITDGHEQPCEACQGLGKVLRSHGHVVFWGLPLSMTAILERKTERLIRGGVNLVMFGIGVAGLIAFGYEIFQEFWNQTFAFRDLLTSRSPKMFVFWISLVCDAYIVYRLEEESRLKKWVTPWTKEARIPLSLFQEVMRLPVAKKQELSTMMTPLAVRAVEQAWLLAHRMGASEVRPLHLLIALTQFRDVQLVFTRLSLTGPILEPKLQSAIRREQIPSSSDVVLSSQLHDVLLLAYEEAARTRQPRVDVTELLIATYQPSAIVSEIFEDLGITTDAFRNVVAWINFHKQFRRRAHEQHLLSRRKPKSHMNRAMTARPTPLLDRVGRDLTRWAAAGAFFPLVGRDKQIEELLRVFSEHSGNVLLIGDSGVGKSALVEGLAELMAAEHVPNVLQDKRLVELNMGALLGAGAHVEAAVTSIIQEMVLAGNVVLHIDDVAHLLGAGSTASGSLDAAAMLQQELTRGRIQVIATTTRQDYAKFLQNNEAFLRRFQIVEVPEMEDADAIQVVEAHSAIYEHRHHVFFSYQAIEAAVKLSRRYVHDRYLPDKALRIAEETAVFVAQSSRPDRVVTADDVASIISERTHVRVTRVAQEEQQLLLHLEEKIHERIVGQEDAVRMVAESLRRARAELRDIKRPIVNLLFLGPTGVGKTELAKTTAEIYFGSETTMIRLDMSEFQDQASIHRLIGPPPGFSGASQGGELTDAVRKSPFALVLLDEFEKAHPEILNVFLQVMDDARLSDSSGRVVDFTNTMIIATSNAGTGVIQDSLKQGRTVEEIRQDLLNRELKRTFRPELLNRFDGIVVFKPLSLPEVEQIAGLLFDQVAVQMEAKGIFL